MDWTKELLNGVHAKKSDAELKMEDALCRYEQHFGKPFPMGGSAESYSSFEAVTAAIEKCIKSNTPAPESPKSTDKIY